MSASSNFVRVIRGLCVALFGVPHRHRWGPTERYVVETTIHDGAVAELWVLRCRICGDISRRRV